MECEQSFRERNLGCLETELKKINLANRCKQVKAKWGKKKRKGLKADSRKLHFLTVEIRKMK